VLVAALVPLIATALGTALGLGARRWHVVVEPVRSFALAAVTVTIAVHLMPEAVEEAGPWAIAVLAGGLMLPSALGWLGARVGLAGDGHATVAVELTFLGVLAHQVGDGLALGTLGADGAWDVLLAIGAHTVPLAAVVAMTFADREGRARAIGRAVLIAVLPLVGLAIGRAGASSHAIAPWLNAAVSGLLLHVLAHDLPSARDRSVGIRTIELIAIAAGIALPLLVRDEHGAHGLVSSVPAALRDLALIAAPPLLAGVLVGAVIHVAARRARVRWLSGGGGLGAALRGAILGVPLPPCSCDIVPVARDLRAQGGGAAFVSAFVLAAPELDVAAVLLTATFFGWQLALVRLLAAVAIAMIAAVVIEQIARARVSTKSDAWIPPGPQSFVDGIDDQIAHDGSWIVVGLVVAAFIIAAAGLGTFSGGVTAALVILAALPLTLSSTAATPIAAALVATGLDPGAMLAAVLLATMLKPSTIAFVRECWGTAAAAATAVATAFAAVAIAFAVRAAAPALDGIALPRVVQLASIAGLGALAAASLWRHGLAHWLAALRGSDHGHEHAHGAEHHDHHHAHDH
jgi:uncharacterized protein